MTTEIDITDGVATVGHNSGKKSEATQDIKAGGVAQERLRSLIERIERLEEEKKNIASDVKDIYAEARSAGFDPKVMRALIVLRRQEPDTVEEFEMLLDTYRRALGC